jgi:hypothetical protein
LVVWLLNGPYPEAVSNAISGCKVITGMDWKTQLIDVQGHLKASQSR